MEVLNGRTAWAIRLGRCMDIRTFSTIHFWYITHSRAFPRWREQSLSPGMQACRQLPPCTPWLSCRFTKPGRSNRCTRVVPTWGWCRSCAWRLTSLYERWKSQRGPSGRRCPPGWSRSTISGSTWQRWRTSTRHAFSTPRRHRRGLYPAVLGSTAAIRGNPVPSTAAPGARPQSARRRGRPPASSRAESTPRPALQASRRRAAPPRIPARRRGESFVLFRRWAAVPTSQERAISFSSGFSGPWDDSVRRPASSLSPTTHFCQQPREYGSGTMYLPTHLWPVPFGTQGVRWGCLRTHRLLYHPPLLPFAAPLPVLRLCRWSRLHSVWRRGSRCPACLAGSRAQFDSAMRFS